MRDPSERKEAVLEVAREKGTVAQVFDRLALSVEYSLYALDDLVAMGQEELEQFEMCVETIQNARLYVQPRRLTRVAGVSPGLTTRR